MFYFFQFHLADYDGVKAGLQIEISPLDLGSESNSKLSCIYLVFPLIKKNRFNQNGKHETKTYLG